MTSRRTVHLVHAMTVGGAEMLVDRLLRASGQDPRPAVIVLDGVGVLGEQLRRDGFELREVHRQPGIDLRIIGRIRVAMAELGAAVLHCHQYTPWFYGSLAAAGTRVRIVFTEHGRLQPDHPRPKRILFNQWMFRRAGAMTAVSESIRRALVENEKIPFDRIELVYNGVDTQHFRPGSGDRSALRSGLGLDDRTFAIASIGRLVEVKNQDLLLRAMARLDPGLPIRLFLAGDGPLEGQLKERAAALDLGDRVRFLGRRGDVDELLQAFDLFTLSSFNEGTSVTLLEAMASGLPSVVTAVGGNPELVRDGREGLLVVSNDEAGLAEAWARLAADPQECEAMAARSRDAAVARFDFGRMRDRFEEIYAEVLA